MFLEAKSKMAKGKPHHTRLSHVNKENEDEFPAAKNARKRAKKKKPAKMNVPNAY